MFTSGSGPVADLSAGVHVPQPGLRKQRAWLTGSGPQHLNLSMFRLVSLKNGHVYACFVRKMMLQNESREKLPKKVKGKSILRAIREIYGNKKTKKKYIQCPVVLLQTNWQRRLPPPLGAPGVFGSAPEKIQALVAHQLAERISNPLETGRFTVTLTHYL